MRGRFAAQWEQQRVQQESEQTHLTTKQHQAMQRALKQQHITQQIEEDWERGVGRAEACLGKVACMSLSAFGRAFSASGYALPQLMFQAELGCMPAAMAARVAAATARVVDRGSATKRPPGVPSRLLAGHPKRGGMGMQPWQHHITARHAAGARALILGLAQPPPAAVVATEPPYVTIARVTLARRSPSTHPALQLLVPDAPVDPTWTQWELPWGWPEGPLARFAAAMRALGPPCPPTALLGKAPGPWCADQPLWGHPHLCLELPLAARPKHTQHWVGQGREGSTQPTQAHVGLRLPDLQTVGALAILHRLLNRRRAAAAAATAAVAIPTIGAATAAAAAAFPLAWQRVSKEGHERLLAEVEAVWESIPVGWARAAEQHTEGAAPGAHPRPTVQAIRLVLGCMTWGEAAATAATAVEVAPLSLTTRFSVRRVTALLHEPVAREQASARREVVAAALALEQPPLAPPALAAAAEAAATALPERMAKVWRLGWENQEKEIWWRLLLGGVSGAGGHGLGWRIGERCPCGWGLGVGEGGGERVEAGEARDHAFWGCAPTVAVRTLLQRHLTRGTRLQARHLWLLEPPAPDVHAEVWAVVALAALRAIVRARSSMFTARQRIEHAKHPTSAAARVVHMAEAVAAANQLALDSTLQGVRDYVAMSNGSGSVLRGVIGAQHAFICEAESCLRCSMEV